MSNLNVEMLIKNPKYDADWIEKVQELMVPDSGCKLIPEISEYADLDKLANLDCRKLHTLSQVIKLCEDQDIKVKIINAIVNEVELNPTQVQLLATLAANIDSEKDKEHKILATLLNPDIPYAVTNYVAKAIMEGFYYIMVYVNEVETDIDQIAAIYATYADKCYDELELEKFIRNNKLIISADKINLLRHLHMNKMKYEVQIKETDDVVITVY